MNSLACSNVKAYPLVLSPLMLTDSYLAFFELIDHLDSIRNAFSNTGKIKAGVPGGRHPQLDRSKLGSILNLQGLNEADGVTQLGWIDLNDGIGLQVRGSLASQVNGTALGLADSYRTFFLGSEWRQRRLLLLLDLFCDSFGCSGYHVLFQSIPVSPFQTATKQNETIP